MAKWMDISKIFVSHILFNQTVYTHHTSHGQLLPPLGDQAGVDDVAAADDHDDRGPRADPPLLQRPAQQPGVRRGQHRATGDLHQHPMVISKPES